MKEGSQMEKVLVIVGPTGVGKTALSVKLAQSFQGEIISGDSMQVYKEMNIGTAKVRPEETQGIPHYLIDDYALTQEYNVKVFQEKARGYMHQISENGKLPIICGGTGLYIKSTLYDYEFVDQEENIEFMDLLHTLGKDQLWSLLKVIDPKACENLHPNNRQRLCRALYMAHTGQKKSDIVESQTHQPIYDAYIIGLTMEREQLYERINRRVDIMMEEGLLEEIEGIVKQYPDCWNFNSFKGIGYKEWKGYFDGTSTKEDCIELIKKNSRNFAKRQYTWFKNQMQVHWYDIQDQEYPENVMHDIDEWMHHK